jgi:hypothetical protein
MLWAVKCRIRFRFYEVKCDINLKNVLIRFLKRPYRHDIPATSVIHFSVRVCRTIFFISRIFDVHIYIFGATASFILKDSGHPTPSPSNLPYFRGFRSTEIRLIPVGCASAGREGRGGKCGTLF